MNYFFKSVLNGFFCLFFSSSTLLRSQLHSFPPHNECSERITRTEIVLMSWPAKIPMLMNSFTVCCMEIVSYLKIVFQTAFCQQMLQPSLYLALTTPWQSLSSQWRQTGLGSVHDGHPQCDPSGRTPSWAQKNSDSGPNALKRKKYLRLLKDLIWWAVKLNLKWIK